MIRTLALWAVLAAPVVTAAQEPPPPPPPPTGETIRLPDITPAQPVSPAAGTPIRLTLDNIYVFDADVEVVVRLSPAGLINLTKESGPLLIRDFFADSPSVRRTFRNYRGKWVYLLEAVPGTRGTCELTVIPTGLKTENQIRSKTFDVDGGGSPLPVPVPVPPIPVPVPVPTDPLFAPLAAAFAADGRPAALATRLAAVYRQSAVRGGTVDNPALTTTEDLFSVMHAAGQTVAPDPALAKTRRVIADELNAKIGRSILPLNDAARAAASAQFTRMAALLEVLK